MDVIGEHFELKSGSVGSPSMYLGTDVKLKKIHKVYPYLSILYSFTHNFMFIHTFWYVRTFENNLRERHNLPVLVLKNKKVSFFSIVIIFGVLYCTIPRTKKVLGI